MDDANRSRLLKLYAEQRADAQRIHGHDPLGYLDNGVDFEGYLADLKRRHCTPEYQASAAEHRRDEVDRQRTEALIGYERQISRLSHHHVKAVTEGCQPNLKPITTTELQRAVVDQWDRAESMFFTGETSIGKTYCATWCAMRLAMSGCTVASTTPERVAMMPYGQLLELHKVDVLVLDQLHTLRAPSGKDGPAWKASPTVDLIDYRYEAEATTIGAGKVNPDTMADILGSDILRRFPLRLGAESGEVRTES